MTALMLEDFVAATSPQDETHPLFEEGYAAGIAAAKNDSTASRTRSLEKIATALEDTAFGYAEAQTFLLKKLHNLLRSFGEKAIPEILKHCFAASLEEHILNNFEASSQKWLIVNVSPENYEEIKSYIADRVPLVTIGKDTDLTAEQAVFAYGEDLEVFDFSIFLEHIKNTFGAIAHISGLKQNG